MAFLRIFILSLLVATNAFGAYLQRQRAFHSKADFERLTSGSVALAREARCQTSSCATLIGSSRGIVLQGSDGSLQRFPEDRLLPYNDATVIAEESPGLIWVGTARHLVPGASTRRAGPAGIQYFASKRWLPDDRVVAIGFERANLQSAAARRLDSNSAGVQQDRIPVHDPVGESALV